MIKPKEISAIKNGKLNADYLLDNYPIKTLVEDLVEIIRKSETPGVAKPIPISREDLDRINGLFRIIGYESNGQPTKRGRKKISEK
ncbi:MAG: hypothetical protein J5801_03265 [Bacteroidales bacterium]|nr:hypothetical protein [Bacteroidales bacterium]